MIHVEPRSGADSFPGHLHRVLIVEQLAAELRVDDRVMADFTFSNATGSWRMTTPRFANTFECAEFLQRSGVDTD